MDMLPPNTHAFAAMLLTLLVLILFTRERIPLETSALVIFIVLVVGFELFPYRAGERALKGSDFFSSFGHPALIAVVALVIAGQGLIRTGALEPLGRALARLWAPHPGLSLLVTLVTVALVSAFVNNTPVIILLLPLLISIARRAKRPASHILMPVGLGTLLGGMTTTIGTSTNLLVVSVAADMGMKPMGMFDFTLPAAMAGGVGLLYLWLIAPRLLPEHSPPYEPISPRTYAAELTVEPHSKVEGKPLAEAIEKTGGEMNVERVDRPGESRVARGDDVVLKEGDRLRVKDTPDQLKEYEHALGTKLDVGETGTQQQVEKTTKELQIAEAVIVHGSPLEGQTLERVDFAARYELAILAIHRSGRAVETTREELSHVTLRTGDVLLLEGDAEAIARLRRAGELLVLSPTVDLPITAKAPTALVIMAGIVLAAATGVLPIAVSAAAGVLLMLVTGCLTWRHAANAVSPPIVLVIVVSLALGTALLETGAADYIARVFVRAAGDAPPAAIASGLMLLMALLTNVMANNAAGVIGTPIAIGIAQQLQQPIEPFVLAVLFGANMGFAIPTETNLLVLNAGRYAFRDFVKVGSLLTLIMWVVFSLILPRLYGL